MKKIFYFKMASLELFDDIPFDILKILVEDELAFRDGNILYAKIKNNEDLEKLKASGITTEVLDELYVSCFNKYMGEIGYIYPSDVYYMKNENGDNYIATAAITTSKSNLPPEYQEGPSYYVYNVCTGQGYRGQGNMNRLLTYAMNKCEPNVPIYLLVDQKNNNAIRSYEALSFTPVDYYYYDGKTFILMANIS